MDRLELLPGVRHLDDVEDGRLVVSTKDSTRDLAEEFLHHTRNGIERIVLNVHQTTLVSAEMQFIDLQEVLFHHYCSFRESRIIGFVLALLPVEGNELVSSCLLGDPVHGRLPS